MYRVVRGALRRLRRDERGNVFILFGASAIPLLLIMGGAVDIARYTRYKTELSNAVDAAALALARQHDSYTASQATAFVSNYVATFNVTDSQFSIQSSAVTTLTDGFHVEVKASMKTMFLPIARLVKNGSAISSIDADIVSEVVNSSNQVELAFVFDNTGSMTDYAGSNACGTGTDKMSGLKCAAKTLVSDLTSELNGGSSPMLKMALVPFEGSVNVNVDTSNPPSWIAWGSNYAGPHYEGVNFAKLNSKYVSHRWLYNKLGVSWAGCVEMRAEPYDVLDTTPDTSNPDTLFVPMFWPDEPDTYTDYWNSYLNDGVTGTDQARQQSLTKYNKSSPSQVSWLSGKKDTSFPYASGPNRGCPPPLTPLTTSQSTIDTAIDAMTPLPYTGTFIPIGLVWGWNVLSSTAPYTEGIGPSDPNYDKTVKAIVLMSDGENSPTIYINHNVNQSTYSSYNYTTTAADNVVSGNHYYRRLQNVNVNSNPTDSVATTNLNNKTATLCANVKAAGIRLYTITFGTVSSAASSLMTTCASQDSSGNALYYSAPTSSELADIFHAIGQDLSEIHLSM